MNTNLKLQSACLAILSAATLASAQGTAFTYQGRLNDNQAPANGNYDLRFALYDSVGGPTMVAAPLTNSAVAVSNGLFAVTLDFGTGVFIGPARWLDIAVRTNGNAAFTTLSLRQALTAAPYAIYASTASNVVGGSVVKSLNNLKDNVLLAAGSNVTITLAGNTLTIASAGDGLWSALNNNAYYTAGNVGIGTSTPAHRLGLAGGPSWTQSSWVGAVDLPNGSALGWQANSAGQRFGMGHANAGFFLFRTASNPGTTGSPALYDFVVNDSGNVGIGTSVPAAGNRLHVVGSTLLEPGGSGGGFIAFGAPNAETGMTISGSGNNRADLRFDGATLKLVATGIAGPPPPENGIAITTAGYVGIGTATPVAKLHAETSQPNTAAVFGNATGSGGVGVYGQSVSGAAIHAEGNAVQTRTSGGFVKAMARINADGTISQCYNGVTGSSSGGCSFSASRTAVGRYTVNFGFQVDDRFVLVTGIGPAACLAPTAALVGLTGTTAAVSVGCGGSPNDAAFFIFVY